MASAKSWYTLPLSSSPLLHSAHSATHAGHSETHSAHSTDWHAHSIDWHTDSGGGSGSNGSDGSVIVDGGGGTCCFIVVVGSGFSTACRLSRGTPDTVGGVDQRADTSPKRLLIESEEDTGDPQSRSVEVGESGSAAFWSQSVAGFSAGLTVVVVIVVVVVIE